ncbi:MAG: hypothetical protein ABI885_15865 [Gammaproteobacteria bacterium]
MNRLFLLTVVAFLPCAGSADARAVEGTPPQGGYEVISNAPLQGKLQAGGRTLDVRGRLSFFVHYTRALAEAGKIEARGMNLVFFDVPQDAITKKPGQPNADLLGIGLPLAKEPLFLKYDSRGHTISGDLPVEAHFNQLDELVAPAQGAGVYDDYSVPAAVPGVITVKISIPAAPPDMVRRKVKGDFEAEIQLNGLTAGNVNIEPFRVSIPDPPVDVSTGAESDQVVQGHLCIQPVIFRANATDPNPTGTSLSEGLKGAKEQWSDTGAVVFDARASKAVDNAALKVIHAGIDETKVRSQSSATDCVEVFFIQRYEPLSTHGGGITWRSGTASAQVIVSDANLSSSSTAHDSMRLAHELGHVVGIGHPVMPLGLFKGSTNTVMCTSSASASHPERNSADNLAHIKNPLLTFELATKPAPPACQKSADCLPCP